MSDAPTSVATRQNSRSMIANAINTGINVGTIAIIGSNRFRAGTAVINAVMLITIITVPGVSTRVITWTGMH